jgi:hypothetical protein
VRARPTLLGKAIALLVGLVLMVAAVEGLLRLVLPHWREFYSGWFMTVTEVPGHGTVGIGVPGFDGYFAQNNGDFRVHIRINQSGLRDDEPIEAADGRVWTIGDSMTFGWGVERDQTFAAVIARESGVPSYNLAAPGANVCGYEALAARVPKTLHPRAVVVGLVLENDLNRYDCAEVVAEPPEPAPADYSFRAIKYYLTGDSALYNFLAVAVKRVAVVQRLLTDLGLIAPLESDQIAPSPEERMALVESTADELARMRKMFPDTPFAVLVVPGRYELKDASPIFAELRTRMDAALAARGIAAIDPFDGLKAAGFASVHFAHDGHWTATGHRIAGDEAAKWVRSVVSGGAAAAKPSP